MQIFHRVYDPLAGLGGLEVEEVRALLAAIPPRPDYDTWLRIASAVWSVLPMGEGAALLNAWSPEEKPGEYAEKHKARLHQIGAGTLIHIARQHGFDLMAHRAERAAAHRAAGSPAPRPAAPCPFVPKGERVTFPPDVSSVDTPTPPLPPKRPDPELVRHAAGQLARVHKAGWITGPDDPDARTFAAAFMVFQATAELSPSQPRLKIEVPKQSDCTGSGEAVGQGA